MHYFCFFIALPRLHSHFRPLNTSRPKHVSPTPISFDLSTYSLCITHPYALYSFWPGSYFTYFLNNCILSLSSLFLYALSPFTVAALLEAHFPNTTRLFPLSSPLPPPAPLPTPTVYHYTYPTTAETFFEPLPRALPQPHTTHITPTASNVPNFSLPHINTHFFPLPLFSTSIHILHMSPSPS